MMRKLLFAFIALLVLMVLLVQLKPELLYEAVFALLEPKECELELAPVATVIRLPADTPEIYESILANPDGSFIVVASSRGELLRVSAAGESAVLAQLPKGEFDLANFDGMLGGLTRGADGAIYVNVNARNPANRGLWRVSENGEAQLWAQLPPPAGANGVAVDRDGNFYIADSSQGLVWKVPAAGGTAKEWYRSKLTGEGAILPMPSANGIQIAGSQVFVANSQGKKVVRLDIAADGSATNPVVWSEGVGPDDFAIDNQGRLFLTTHPFNSVIRMAVNEPCKIVGDVSTGLAGPTAAVFGLRGEDRNVLYVVNDGGYSRAVPGGYPAIVGLDIGSAGPVR